ncbi:MAG TPA: fibrillarin-like rRNA/tRNA 2'-O-methyltransferase [Thermoplasmata archaeon]|nr:fibrillarin-like rRNA/tRNA 2'-O-methyltransferase [Thermoplasmata archaeon]
MLYSVNREPGRSVYGEELIQEGGRELRHWDPWRSKLAALVLKHGEKVLPEAPRRVLYLGAAHGTTASHLSDLWPESSIFVVERSPVAFSRLLDLARRRPNLLPILADAQLPERYAADVGPVDFLYQDVAQRAQAAIFAENARAAAAERVPGILMLKTRSVTQRQPTKEIVRLAQDELGRHQLEVRASVDLTPFARDHAALLIGP